MSANCKNTPSANYTEFDRQLILQFIQQELDYIWQMISRHEVYEKYKNSSNNPLGPNIFTAIMDDIYPCVKRGGKNHYLNKQKISTHGTDTIPCSSTNMPDGSSNVSGASTSMSGYHTNNIAKMVPVELLVENAHVNNFIVSCLRPDRQYMISFTDIYKVYQKWAGSQTGEIISQQSLLQYLQVRYPSCKYKKNKYFLYLGLY